MPLTREQVAHIAQLARLRLTETELETFQGQLSDILDHVAQLAELDTSGIPPTSSVLPGQMRLRVDEPRPGIGAETLAQSSPDWYDDQFRVPPIFD